MRGEKQRDGQIEGMFWVLRQTAMTRSVDKLRVEKGTDTERGLCVLNLCGGGQAFNAVG